MFSEETSRCEWPENVDCDDELSCYDQCRKDGGSKSRCRKQCKNQPTEVPAEVPESDYCEDGIHRHETECNVFYQCANGIRFADVLCPDGLLFSEVVLVCDWPENVNCGENPTPSSPPSTVPPSTSTPSKLLAKLQCLVQCSNLACIADCFGLTEFINIF